VGALGLGGALLAACQPKIVQVTSVVKEVVKETVIVEGTPQVVEKVVEKVVTAQPTAKGKAQIIYYDRTADATKWGDAWNSLDTNIAVEVQIQPPGSRYEQLVAAITAGNAPDVIGLDCVQVGRFAQLAALMPLQDIIPTETMDKYFQGLISNPRSFGFYEGNIVGVPFWLDMSVMFYNKEMMTAAGGNADVGLVNWDEIKTVGKAATKGDVFGMSLGQVNAFIWGPYLWATGGDYCDPEWTESWVDKGETEQMFQFFRDIVNVDKITNDAPATNWGDMQNLFTAQKAMTVHTGGGFVGLIRREFPDLWAKLGICLIPGPKTGQTSSFIGGNVASIATQTKELDAAKEFLIWLTAGDGQAVTGEIGFLPGTAEAMDLDVYQKDWDKYAPFKLGLETGYASDNDPRFDEAQQILNTAFIDSMLNEKPMKEIIDQCHTELDRLLKR
jgi:multiple sugar transport system substrate-binding protein